MNRAAASRKRSRKRSYDNRLRAQQAEQTRQRVLESVVELLAERGEASFTLAELAQRAGVSEPTLYRHFGGRDGLYEAVDAYVQSHLHLPPYPERFEELPQQARQLYARFAEHQKLLTAASLGKIGKELRARGKARRYEAARGMVRAGATHLDERDAHAIAAVMRQLISMDSYVRLTEELGLDAEQAGDAVEWALSAFVEKLERDRRAGRGSLRPDTATDTDAEGRGGDR